MTTSTPETDLLDTVPVEERARIHTAARTAAVAAYNAAAEGERVKTADAAYSATIAREVAAWHARQGAPVPPSSPAYPDCCLRHRTNGPRGSSCGSLAYTGPDATPETLARERAEERLRAAGYSSEDARALINPATARRWVARGPDVLATPILRAYVRHLDRLAAASPEQIAKDHIAPPNGPRDVVGEALRAVQAHFGGEDDPAHADLYNFVTLAAEEHAEIRRLASERLTRVAKARRERKAADRAAGRVTEAELAEIEARTADPPLAGDGEALRRLVAEVRALQADAQAWSRACDATSPDAATDKIDALRLDLSQAQDEIARLQGLLDKAEEETEDEIRDLRIQLANERSSPAWAILGEIQDALGVDKDAPLKDVVDAAKACGRLSPPLAMAPIAWSVAVDIAKALCAEGDITQQAATVMRLASRRAEQAVCPALAADANLDAVFAKWLPLLAPHLNGEQQAALRADVGRAVDASRPGSGAEQRSVGKRP